MATLDFWQLLGLINTEFPQYVPILQKPGIFDVFARYAQAQSSGVNPWTNDQLLAELHKTPYYTATNDAGRQWDMLQATDPATAATKAADTKRMFNDAEAQLGVQVTTTGGFGSPGFQLFQQAVSQGWDATRIKYEIASTVNGTQTGGDIGKNSSDAQKMANDYGLPLSDQQALNYGKQLSSGAIDTNTLTGDFLAQAKSLYPSMSAMLDRGSTVRQIATPYLSLAQQELNIDPNTVSLTDPKWMKALNQVDPKTGDRTVMPLDQWLTTLRTDPSYGYDATDKGKQDATALTTQLQKAFGAA